MVVDGESSEEEEVTVEVGVLQNTLLDPGYFFVHVNDVGEGVTSNILADDGMCCLQVCQQN